MKLSNTKNQPNALQIGQKVKYEGRVATVIGFAKAFAGYPAVTLEFKAIFADFGKNYAQIDQRGVIEEGLEVVS